MPRASRGTYYLGRVAKFGDLDDERIIKAILAPKPIVRRQSAWTFIDARRFTDSNRDFVFARLVKYSPDAEVKVVDPQRRAEVLRSEPNLTVAGSPFIYIPAHSGIVFLRVAQEIEQHHFAARFSDLIEAAYDAFFVRCQVEFISDLRTFAAKLSKLTRIFRLTAILHPPNPLFGPLWSSLKSYMEERGVDTLQHDEEALPDGALNTQLPGYVVAASAQTDSAPYQPEQPLPIGDAAILMAADGYGSGLVHGKRDEHTVVIRTADTVRNFTFARDPDPNELYETSLALFEEIERQRHLEHGDSDKSS